MADVELLEQFDNFAGLRNALHGIADEKEHWAGIPMPLQDLPLVVEPRYPKAKELMQIGREEITEEDRQDRKKLRNSFWSTHRRCRIHVWNEGDRIEWGLTRGVHHFDQDLSTMGASDAWGIEQESRALQLLATMLRHHQFKKYLLTGMFLESSPRSGVMYVFRKLRPTIAVTHQGERLKILCALCLHPIAYYDGSWAGAMCPTDDVIAHLMLMRANEPLFWRRANQHAAHLPEAGL